MENLDFIPAGMTGKSIVGGNYVKRSAKGDLKDGFVGAKWSEIWAMDLQRKFTADFEAYGEKARDPANAEVDFFIAVK